MITGSVAYDTILTHNGRFADKLEKGDLRHVNLTFLAPEMHRDFGGCAANIAYALHQLGGDPFVWSALGRDGGDYLEHFRALGIPTDGMPCLADCFTSQAFIVTDVGGCQLASFHPGAMDASDRLSWPEDRSVDYALLGPGGVRPMKLHARLFRERGVPYLFDPGQAGPLFTPEELRDFADGADACAFSDFEAEYLEKVAGLTPEALSLAGKTVYHTHGEKVRPCGLQAEKGSKSKRSPRRPSTPWARATPIGAAFSSRGNGISLRSSAPASAPSSEASRWRCGAHRTGARPRTMSAASTRRTGAKPPSEGTRPPYSKKAVSRCGAAFSFPYDRFGQKRIRPSESGRMKRSRALAARSTTSGEKSMPRKVGRTRRTGRMKGSSKIERE